MANLENNEASRGPTGSLILLGKLRAMHLVSIGAVITVVSIAFGPFAQQVVTYPLRPHETQNATTPRATFYTEPPGPVPFVGSETLAAIYEGLGVNNQTFSSVTPLCSTGNCTWTDYSSLGLCPSVSDITPALKRNPCNLTTFAEIFEFSGVQNPGYPCYNYSLDSQGISADATDDLPPLTLLNVSLTNGDVSEFSISPEVASLQILNMVLGNYSPSVLNFYVLYQPNLKPESSIADPIALQLTLDFCVHTYSTTVVRGKTNTELISSQLINTTILESDNYFPNATLSIGNESFGITFNAFASLQDEMILIFGDSCSLTIGNSSQAANTSEICDNVAAQSFLNAFESSDDMVSAAQKILDNMAISITNTFRAGTDGNTERSEFLGIAFSSEVFVESQYIWLTLPLGLVLLTFVFLVATISKSHRLGSKVWKSSNLATLQALDNRMQNRLGGLSLLSEMEEKAENMEVGLKSNVSQGKNGSEWKFVSTK